MKPDIRAPWLSSAMANALFKEGNRRTANNHGLAVCVLSDDFDRTIIFRRAGKWATLESASGELYARKRL